MASALKFPRLSTPLSKLSGTSAPMTSPRNPWGHAHIGGPTGPYLHKTSDVFCNPGRFQNVPTARSQGEVYIHEHDHGFVDSQSPRLCSFGDSVSSQRSLGTVRSQRGEVSGRANAARRISEYRATHLHPVRESYPERVPAVQLYQLSEEFRKQSRLSRRISPGTRAPFTGPLLTSTAQLFGGSAVNLSPR